MSNEPKKLRRYEFVPAGKHVIPGKGGDYGPGSIVEIDEERVALYLERIPGQLVDDPEKPGEQRRLPCLLPVGKDEPLVRHAPVVDIVRREPLPENRGKVDNPPPRAMAAPPAREALGRITKQVQGSAEESAPKPGPKPAPKSDPTKE